jgi:hypothetical protein
MSDPTNSPANELAMQISNNSGAPITITRVYVQWIKTPDSQKLDRLLLNGAEIWNRSDPNPPSDIPTDGGFVNGANLTIDFPTTPQSFVLRFMDSVSGGYAVHVVFDTGAGSCQVIKSSP